MASKQLYLDLAKLIHNPSHGAEYLEHFNEKVEMLKRAMARDKMTPKQKAKYLEGWLNRIKEEQTRVGKHLTMLNIDRLAILALKSSEESK